MARGFIRNPLDVRLLILYILDHLISPVTMAELTDLALCDEGLDYFQFATALGALTENGHVAECGTHAALMQMHGRYYELFTTQAERYISGETAE